MDMKLSAEEQNALAIITKGSFLLQPAFDADIEQTLLEAALVRQTLGGTLKATEKGQRLILKRRRR